MLIDLGVSAAAGVEENPARNAIANIQHIACATQLKPDRRRGKAELAGAALLGARTSAMPGAG